LSVFIVYPIIYSLVIFLILRSEEFKISLNTCAPALPASIIGICQTFITLIVEFFFLGGSLRYIWKIVSSVRGGGASNSKFLLTIKFVVTIFLQTTNRMSFNVTYVILYMSKKSDIKTLINAGYSTVIICVICYFLNATVVLVGNKSLINWLKRKYYNISVNSSGSGDSGSRNKGAVPPTINSSEFSDFSAGSSAGSSV